jgi:hypothetical protein
MDSLSGRRLALKTLGLVGIAAGLAAFPDGGAKAADASLLPQAAKSLKDLAARLSRAPRRRDFTTVPMILTAPDQWDHAALLEVIGYRGGPKQVWDNTDIGGPWLNFMRNALNSQVWSFQHPDFFVASARHGTAHLALFKPAMWDKYQLAKLTGGTFQSNTLITEQKGAAADPKDFENTDGVFSPRQLHTGAAAARRGVPRVP